MPLRFRIDTDANLVITTAEGEVTAEDLAEHARALAAHPDRPLFELVDFSDRVDVTISPDVVRSAAFFLAEHDANAPGARLAFVAKSDVIYGMTRLFQANRSHPNVAIEVFRDRDEALRWLHEGMD